ncbi:outer membrane protein [Planctobacterium marinum]|uniref:Outer membrane protein beta-barrel domain-containing protein n=1 Tax=Planctobacterium marinum TaxID=1631968 RepID=A0AA48KWF7_9ALTE|nr:hypothetical protein MACH26_40310 [Planctobacterium marinum]
MKRQLFIFTIGLTSLHALADNASWYVKPYLGLSSISDQQGTLVQAANNTDITTNTDSGFTSGIALGYQYNAHYSAELGWEYRSSDTDSQLSANDNSYGGNYASSLFFLNGFYHLASSSDWTPYVGAGLAWVQEVDLDLELNGTEQSYSGDGDTGYQLMLGVDYAIGSQWQANAELRYLTIGDIDLQGEENATGELRGFDYDPMTLSVALKYRF